MQQFFSSINFCLRNAGYLAVLCLPAMTLEIALANLIASLEIQSGSEIAALEAIGEISTQVFVLVVEYMKKKILLTGVIDLVFLKI